MIFMKLETPVIGLIVAALVVGMVIGFSTSALFSSTSDEKTDIRYGGQYYPGEFLLYGNPEIWDSYNIKVDHTLFSSGGEGNEALIAGNVDINVGSDSKTVALFNAIPDEALIIGTVQRGDRYSTVVKVDSSYQTWDDLVGETVGTRYGTGAEATLRKYFESNLTDLTWDDFSWIDINVEDMTAALEAGQIKAFTAWESTPGIAVAQGVGRILRSYGDIAQVPVSIHTTKSFAYSHPNLVIAFLAAQLEKHEIIETEINSAANYAKAAADKIGVDVSSDAFLGIFGRIDFQIEFNQSIIDEIYDTADFLLSQGKIDKLPTIVWDTTFLEAAIKLRAIVASQS
jgi:ABC-type nitrate/sulfonate/bicarbonate transport system substrate-binding protein